MKKYLILEMILAAALANCGRGYQHNLEDNRQAKTEIVQAVLPVPEVSTKLPVTIDPLMETPAGKELIPVPSIIPETTASREMGIQATETQPTSKDQQISASQFPTDHDNPMAGTDRDVTLIDESFASSEGWDQFDNKYARGAIENGHYSITIRGKGRWSWVLHGPRGASFYYQGTVTVVNCNPGDNYGLLFRAKDDGSFLLFSASCEGQYRLVRAVKGELDTIVPWTASNSIDKHHYMQVYGTEDGLTMRFEPRLNAEVSHFARDYEVFRVVDGPMHADGMTWWLLEDRNDISRSGWGVDKYLRETHTNVLGVRAEGHHFNLYLNGEHLTSATNEIFSGGKFGIYAASAATPELYVTFDDLIVYPVIGRGVPLAPSPSTGTEIVP